MSRPAPSASTTVGVVGAGTMGNGIAEVSARAGCRAVVVETQSEALERARHSLAASLGRGEAKGALTEPADAVLARVSYTSDLADLRECSIVIEAIRESLTDKVALIVELDGLLAPDAVIASNTSSIPIAKLAAASVNPERVIGMHFFNPVPVMPLVEIIPSLLTASATDSWAHAFARTVLQKTTVSAQDRAGFLVNTIFVPYALSAIRMLDSGLATAEDIDAGLVGGCGMPMGPIRLADMIGLDTMLLVAESLYEEYLDPAFAPPVLLRRHVDAGRLGRKSGRGFYAYP